MQRFSNGLYQMPNFLCKSKPNKHKAFYHIKSLAQHQHEMEPVSVARTDHRSNYRKSLEEMSWPESLASTPWNASHQAPTSKQTHTRIIKQRPAARNFKWPYCDSCRRACVSDPQRMHAWLQQRTTATNGSDTEPCDSRDYQ